MSQDDLTPSRKQYLDMKAQHADEILLFRMGDFYECFDADAELVARELDIVLTSRPNGKGPRVPMAGVPLTPQPPLPKGEGEPDQSSSPSGKGVGVRAGGDNQPIYHGNVNTP